MLSCSLPSPLDTALGDPGSECHSEFDAHA